MTKISLIVPSRLQVNPASETGRLYLGRALQSAQDYQTADVEIEAVVGLDPGMLEKVPAYLIGHKVKYAVTEKPGQAAAVNAAVRESTGDVLAFLEDDDTWVPQKLAIQLDLLKGYEMVTCVQRVIDEAGNFLGNNSFATPSGWLMNRAVWEHVGGFDESFRFHVDTEWLGRANARHVQRVHLTPDGYAWDGWMENVAQNSQVYECRGYPEPLVNRTENSQGGMMMIKRDPQAFAQSNFEHGRMMERFGKIPW